MKGKLLFFLAALLAIAQGAWADEVTVYSSATTAIRYVPVDGWNVNEYQKSEFVIPAAQLQAMDGGTISQMTFYMQTSAPSVWPGNFQVFLKEVNSTTISDFSGTSGATTVYEGTLDATGSELTITFNKGNYTYNGGNLLVGVYHIETGAGYAFTYFYGETVSGASVQGHSSSSLASVTASQQSSIPMTTFTYTPGSVAKPATLQATSVTSNSATLNWTGGTGTYNVEYKAVADANWTSATTNLAAYTYALTGLDENTAYQARVQSVNGGDVSGWKIVSFTTLTNDAVPYELSTTGIYANAATLNWTGAQNSYNVCYRSFSPAPDFVEGFEDELSSSWQVISNTENSDRIGRHSDAKRTDDYGFRFSSFSRASDYNQYLISPDVSGAQSVVFYYKSSNGVEETFRVGYSTTGNDVDNFTWEDKIQSSSMTWTKFELNLPDGVKYVAINYYSQYKYYLYIDDITIKCASVGEWVEKNGVTSPLDIDGLEQGTKYEWQVQGIYNSVPTEWSTAATFTTTDELKPGTHKATFASGNDNDGWSISPTSGTEGTTVTVSYDGTSGHKVKSVRVTKILPGKFTINASGDQVHFSSGNLQATYNGTAWSWDFAANQWDYIGNAEGNTKVENSAPYVSDYTGTSTTVDLFGWSSNANYYGINKSDDITDYSGDFVDWGNNIGSGWRTLTNAEWVWILGRNTDVSTTPGTDCRVSGSTVNGTENARYTLATINTDGTSVNGMILFPDGVTIAADEATSWGTINSNSDWSTKCTTAQWTALETKGCVFLPAAGYRYWKTARDVGSLGRYSSSTLNSSNGDNIRCVNFTSDLMASQLPALRNYGCSVRLVKDAE